MLPARRYASFVCLHSSPLHSFLTGDGSILHLGHGYPRIHIDVHDSVLAGRVSWLVNLLLFALLVACHCYGVHVLKRRGMYMEPRSEKPPAGTGVAEWRCPVCGNQNDRWYVSCHHCGADRPDGPTGAEDEQ